MKCIVCRCRQGFGAVSILLNLLEIIGFIKLYANMFCAMFHIDSFLFGYLICMTCVWSHIQYTVFVYSQVWHVFVFYYLSLASFALIFHVSFVPPVPQNELNFIAAVLQTSLYIIGYKNISCAQNNSQM